MNANPFTHEGVANRNALYRESHPDNDFVSFRDQYRRRGWANQIPLYNQDMTVAEKKEVLRVMSERLHPADTVYRTSPLEAQYAALKIRHHELLMKWGDLLSRRLTKQWEYRTAERLAPIPPHLLDKPAEYAGHPKATVKEVEVLMAAIGEMETAVNALAFHLDQQAQISTAFAGNPALDALVAYIDRSIEKHTVMLSQLMEAVNLLGKERIAQLGGQHEQS